MALPQGDISRLGASGSAGPPSFGRPGELAAVGIGDRAQGLPRPLDSAGPPQRTAFKGTVGLEPQIVRKARSNVLVDKEPSSELGAEHEHDDAEDGEH